MNLQDLSKVQLVIRSIKRKYPKDIKMGFHKFACNNHILNIYVKDFDVYCDPEFIKIRDFVRRWYRPYFKKRDIVIIFVCKY
jgi:hypothetical protein